MLKGRCHTDKNGEQKFMSITSVNFV